MMKAVVPVYRLPEDDVAFPDPALADDSGLLAVGGDLSPERLVEAYATGIFPWYSKGEPILWWSPDPRLVLEPATLHVPRSLRKAMRSRGYDVRFDTAFEQVIRACAATPRPGQRGTWITEEMVRAYLRLHELGLAHSAEAWDAEGLAGGLYGVSLGAAFFGESMFAHRTDASKIAFVTLVESLSRHGCELIDCQVTTEHLLRFGAREIPRGDFLDRLAAALDRPTRRGRWSVD
jgi:leucyl/phenylalanyl-tRNA---protein transferase